MERLYGVYWNGWEWNETIRNGMKDSMYMRFIMYGIVYTGWQIMDGWFGEETEREALRAMMPSTVDRKLCVYTYTYM